MIMHWILFICINTTAMGCGSVIKSPMPDMETCFKALAVARQDYNGQQRTNGDGRATVFACITDDSFKVKP